MKEKMSAGDKGDNGLVWGRPPGVKRLVDHPDRVIGDGGGKPIIESSEKKDIQMC